MSWVLFADAAGPRVQMMYGRSHYVLAGLVPATLVSESDSIPAKIADLGLAAALPLHSHVGLNYVVADYVPRRLQVPARVAVLGLSGVMFMGLLKLTLGGPGIGGAIKELWRRPSAEAAAKA